MHHKFGLFDYGSTNRRVFVGSWNFTSAASYQQWNIAIDVTSPALYSAFTNEARELMAGRFHYDSAKSHAHDGARFRLTGDWGENWVRFAPYPNGSDGGSNALTDITNCIAGAQSEIVFALNMLTRPAIASALVSAADRGVQIHGVIPKSDQWSEGSVYSFLTNTTHYATTNRVQFETPYSKADGSAIDAGETDLVHSKWMAIDPWSERPMLIHGSANWTDAALASPSANDEYVLFLRHRDMTRMFYAQFKRMTGLWSQRDDFWCDIGWTRGTLETGLWMTDAQEYILQRAEALGAWPSDGSSITGLVGRLSVSTNGLDSKMFYRALRK